MAQKDSIIIERSTNYAYTLSNSDTPLSFSAIRDISAQFYKKLPEEDRISLYNEIDRGICPLNSEDCLNTYMYALGKMHNAKLREAYKNLSESFLQHETIDIVDYGCGQAMGCICYADFLREKELSQRVRRVVLIEPSELALARAALHVSRLFPDAEIVTIPKGFDQLCPEDLHSDAEVATLHILSNVLDMGDQFFDLNKFADLVANTIAGYNEFVCVEPQFFKFNIDSKPDRFFERLQIEPYFQFKAGSYEFVRDEKWTCALLLGMADKSKKVVLTQGIAAVFLNDKWSIIDIFGKRIVPLRYEWIRGFHEGLAGIELNGKWGFIDTTEQIVVPPKYDWVWDFHEGFAQIKLNSKWGVD